MKYLLVVLLGLSFYSLNAQGTGNMYGNRFSGRGRSVVPNSPSPAPSSYEEAIDPNVLSLERAAIYEETLSLDVFTKEVLRSHLEDYYKTLIAIQDDETMPIADKRKAVELEKKKFEKNLGAILSDEQITQILAAEESGQTQKKVDKKKKQERKRKRRKKGE